MLFRKTLKPLLGLLVLAAPIWVCSPRALALNCTSNISAPCTIASAGSYTLTGNVSGGTGGDAISVTANDVTINLNGWKLTGGSSSGDGVDACSSGCTNNTTITSGHVFSSGAYGLYPGTDVSDIEDVQATYSGSSGMYPAAQAIVYHNIATNNGIYGIQTSGYTVVERNVAASNSSYGIYEVTAGTVVSESSSDQNTGYGLSLTTGDGYSRNVTGGNSTGGCSGGTSMGENLCN